MHGKRIAVGGDLHETSIIQAQTSACGDSAGAAAFACSRDASATGRVAGALHAFVRRPRTWR